MTLLERCHAEAKKQVTEWNKAHSVGTDVMLRRADETVKTKTRTEAVILNGHTPVIKLEGIDGWWCLDAVTAINHNTEGETKCHSK